MDKNKKPKNKKIGKGAIEVNRDRLTKLKIGEMEKIVGLIRLLCENVLDEANLDSRTVLMSYGNPSVVKIDLVKLSKLSYEEVRQLLLKLFDMQKSLVNDEMNRLEKVLGK